jgi:hypothetical protein
VKYLAEGFAYGSHAGVDLSSLSLPDLFEANPTFLEIFVISVKRIYISQLPSENCGLCDVPQVIWCLGKHPEVHYSPVKDVIVLKPTANKQHPLRAETYDPIRPRPSTSRSLRQQKNCKRQRDHQSSWEDSANVRAGNRRFDRDTRMALARAFFWHRYSCSGRSLETVGTASAKQGRKNGKR